MSEKIPQDDIPAGMEMAGVRTNQDGEYVFSMPADDYAEMRRRWERCPVADAEITTLRARLAALEADLAHMRSQAGPDSCADYAVRCRELEAIIREVRDLIEANAGGYDALASFAYDQLREMLAKEAKPC